MRTRFLLGPAGTGKTFRCLAEIRAALQNSPEGAPLILLAPKQATFQLERQLLADETLSGYTRLQILHFEKLADFVLTQLHRAPSKLLSEEGRVMVLRALLLQNKEQLKIFRASARMPGFAQQLSLLLRELQRHQLSPAKLFKLSEKIQNGTQLGAKLHDLALLLSAYFDWLKKHELHDANSLLDIATEVLRAGKTSGAIRISGLWLDGFAEMTPQELDFLAALVPFCDAATLAFCVDYAQKNPSALSIWSVVHKTFQECHARLQQRPDCKIEIENLSRSPDKNRFAESLPLRHLEEHWTSPKSFDAENGLEESLRVAECGNPESEAILAAHEILEFVRNGGRFRKAAVLLRSFDGYHDTLRRVFSRYEIPFFLDRRQSIAHHPLAELTRGALRLATFNWEHDDFFCVLKTGLVTRSESRVDQLENAALAHGWKKEMWLHPLKFSEQQKSLEYLEEFRRKLVPPFQKFCETIGNKKQSPNGIQLAQAIRRLWSDLDIETQLEKWTEENPVHATVLQQMENWLENIERAFPSEPLRLADWLPICESGLSGMTAGAIPPALDQVLIGTIDRSRNPDLDLVFVLGLNESVFPAAPKSGTLLSEADQIELSKHEITLGANKLESLGRERFYGYIACTRSKRRLVLTRAAQDNQGRALNRSPFFSLLERLFPTVREEKFSPTRNWTEAEHQCELIAPLISAQSSPVHRLNEFASAPMFHSVCERIEHFRVSSDTEMILPKTAEELYGAKLETSVSALEKFAACPLQFFISSGLRAKEREIFELDARERGKFQHAILEKFHQELTAKNRRWRDISVGEARELIAKIGGELKLEFRDGLLDSEAQNEFQAQSMIESLQDFIETAIGWMRQYEFDPSAVELSFGKDEKSLPAWEIDLDGKHKLAFRGTIDRVDLYRLADRDESLAVVMDYKSSAKKIDPILLENGVQLQLPAYLAFLRQLPDAKQIFGAGKLIPAGVFYVNLRGHFDSGKTRADVLNQRDAVQQKAYQHTGRFDFSALKFLDNSGESKGTQFNYRLKNNGEPHANSRDVMTAAQFNELLDGVEGLIREMGTKIFSGEAKVDPYQKGKNRACDKCDYMSICRIDSWRHKFRILKKSEKQMTTRE